MLPFSLVGFEIQQVTVSQTGLTISTCAVSPTAICPSCQEGSHRVPSSSTRSLADLPIRGQDVQLILRVRRFRCQHLRWLRQTFVEPIPEVVPVQARRTTRLRVLLDCLAFVLSAQAQGIAPPASFFLKGGYPSTDFLTMFTSSKIRQKCL